MTTTEIAEQNQDAGTLAVFPPARAHSTHAVAMLHEHAEVYNTAWKLAGQLVQTTMVPKRFADKQGDATAAILYGAELGLNPIQSLQRVIPIHGMPSLEARTMVGLLKAQGYKVRTTAQSDESVTVEGESPDGETYTSTWTIARAKQAGYVPTPAPGVTNPRPDEKNDWVTTSKTWNGKTTISIAGNMKYITDPQTMLKAKAQAEVCRELAPDVLMGISYSREELESEDQRQFDRMDERGAVPARVQNAPVTVDEIFAEEVPVPDPEPATSGSDNSAKDFQADVTPETPAGDEDPGAEQPAPAESPSPAAPATSNSSAEPEPGQVTEPPKKAPAKKTAAKKAAPREASKLRAPLEKRLFALLGDAGLSGSVDRDGRLAVYAAILNRDDITSTNDLTDVEVGTVCDQLYVWSQQNELDDQIGGILADAARDAEETAAAPAAAPTSEGTE
jgi:hypothetical protein